MSLESLMIIFLIAIPVYFISRFVLKRFKIGNNNTRRFVAILPTIIISPILYFGGIMIWIFSVSYYPKIDFNQQKWTENTEERYKMSDDIIKNKILIGKTKSEIIELLGEDFYKYDENHIAYDLGFVPGLFNIDPDVLDIYFENGKVIKVGQHET